MQGHRRSRLHGSKETVPAEDGITGMYNISPQTSLRELLSGAGSLSPKSTLRTRQRPADDPIDLTREETPSAGVLPSDLLGPFSPPLPGTYTSHYKLSVFDFLEGVPMEHFGNQANRLWALDEDVFEQTNLPVEEKVVTCLWARWITVNG